MKIALTTSGSNLDAPLASRFGRTSRLLIYDTETKTYNIRDNKECLNTAAEAGMQLAVQLIDEDLDCVISRHFGSIAYETLTAGGIRVYICKAETVREAIHKLTCGELKEAKGANVLAHWA